MDMSEGVGEFRLALGQRIAELITNKYGTKIAASEAIGWSTDQINKWIAGSVKVPLEALWLLSQGSNADFSWLCQGPRNVVPLRFPRERPFQEPVLRDVLIALADIICNEGVTFQPEQFPGLVFDLHDYVCERRAKDAGAADLEGITHFVSHALRAQRSR